MNFEVKVVLQKILAIVFTGYSLRFSFHNTSAVPQRLPFDRWNCSVPHWPDFKQHLQCNLLSECVGGEDEADCVYTTNGTCRHGYMAAGGSCFSFDPLYPTNALSWADAYHACKRRGARLPELKTPAKWRAVLDLLSHRGWENIYIGLSSGDPSLPDLYRDVLQWTDSSIAYYVKADFFMESHCKTCAFLKKTRRPDFVYMDSCYKKVHGSLMCEVEEGSSNSDPCINNLGDHKCDDLIARFAYCALHPGPIVNDCKKSCGHCGPPSPSTPPQPAEGGDDGATTATEDSLINVADDYDCEQWAQRGECGHKAAYMRQHCQKACRPYVNAASAFQATGDHCLDYDNNCDQWVKKGYCDMFVAFMQTHCRKTCTGCNSATLPPQQPEAGDATSITVNAATTMTTTPPAAATSVATTTTTPTATSVPTTNRPVTASSRVSIPIAITFTSKPNNTGHFRFHITRCPKGHVTHHFLSCDTLSDCYSRCYTSLSAPLTSLPPTFQCHNGLERVPFTLVCDHREDCSDASDEICVYPPCQEFECTNKQCLPLLKKCDGIKDCLDGTDEMWCELITGSKLTMFNFSKALPAMVLHDGKGLYDLLDITDPSAQSTSSSGNLSSLEGCPGSHFECPGVSYYCLPVYVRCNGVHDCPGHQDEAGCENAKCPGFYRCRGSKVCLHRDHVCDGIIQCPQGDDELMCGFVCPVGCTCYGLAFFCAVSFDASRYVGLRFLDASGSGIRLKDLYNHTMLFYLSLAKCNITELEPMNLKHVFHLDLSENNISTLKEKHVNSFQNLQVFVIAGNPLRTIVKDYSPGRGVSISKLHTLDLSAVSITAAQMVNLHVFSNVRNLNLSNTGLDAVSGFSVFGKLQVLDLRGCPLTYFTRSVFQGLHDLSTVYADNYKLCCPETLPGGFNVLNCHAPFDEVSSCEGLLKSGLYRVSLSVLTSMTLIANAGSFVYRVFINRPKQQSSFALFVTNLCLSDFLMGLYSAIIGVADRLYLGNYVWNDVTWRKGVTCQMAGVLSLMSNEVSVLIICLITIDRFLVTRFPFSLHLHFSPRSARVSCVTAWTIGVLLAVAPLLPMTSHWELYSQTGICIPLPVTRRWFAGRDYSYGVLIILNFVLFLVIASGQMSIYLSVRANSMTTSDTTQKTKDLTIARRLITVAVSDFLCWFPVGILGMLSSRGHPIPGEASVIIAVFVMPLNSALNPFLYTVNVILERRQRAREQRLQKMVLARHAVATARREGEERK